MHILLLAPHPFFQERGTPIAVRLLLQALSEAGHKVDVVTFHEGEDVTFPGVTLHRIRKPWGIKDVGPGFSLKKLVCDAWLFFRAWGLVRRERPDGVHAVEESVFMAPVFRRPYVYDMDSCLSAQLTDKAPILKVLAPVFRWMERRAVRGARAVVPVCPALANIAHQCGAKRVVLLPDISLLDPGSAPPGASLDLPEKRGIRFTYIGNLEPYQGVDLLVEALSQTRATRTDLELVVVGGSEPHRTRLRDRCRTLGVEDVVHIAGPRPTSLLSAICADADVLVSPRTLGVNTPMKVYSYLDSGRPVLATRLPTHTQVLSEETACLAAPNPEALAAAMLRLAGDPDFRGQLGQNGRLLAQSDHSYAAFAETVRTLYPSTSEPETT